MDWQRASRNWPAFVEAVGDRWPRVEQAELLAIEGDRDRFEAYVASRHDLTPAEVREDVETWLIGELPAGAREEAGGDTVPQQQAVRAGKR